MYRGTWLAGCLLIASAGVCSAAESPCLAAAKTDLERLYCDVVSDGGGAGLPSPTDFKRNNPSVQALLLRRPAERLGLTLPETADAPAGDMGQALPVEPAPGSAVPAEDAPETADSTLAECRLDGKQLVCPQQRFVLADNQHNRALATGALAADNRLGLPSFEGDRNNDEAVRQYLSNAYDRYIPKMLAIGLGANTMSFTAFHNAFYTMEESGVDFTRRMEQTYQLLKQDKKKLAVKARYHDKLPQDIALCSVINRDVIVCDDVGTNWVFVSPLR